MNSHPCSNGSSWGPAATLPERIALARREQLDYASLLEIILSDEVNRRAHRRIEMRLQGAGLQEICRLEDFDWSASITMDRRLLDAVFSLEFLDRHEHVLLVGPAGVGKSFLAQALGYSAVRAGLPQVRGRMGKAKSYAERLFDFPEIGPLSDTDARLAIAKPAAEEGIQIEPGALDFIVRQTQCYPYFLQEWGKHVWDVAMGSPVTTHDVEVASQQAVAALDGSFFLVRFDRLTPSQKKYVRAMAALGPGPHRSGDIASELKRQVSALAPVRSQLISKGMIWSPSHGDTAFTVPMFDEFMLRIMPGEDWR